MLHLMFDPTGMRPHLANWEALAKALIQRVYREATGHSADPKTHELVQDLLAYPQVQADWKTPQMPTALPMIRVECLYPVDDETETLHAKLLSTSSRRH